MARSKALLDILIAEDDETLAAALSEFLKEKGHQVDLAAHGGEALALLERQSYPLIITDLVMPEADGLTVLRAARQRDPATLVVIMTGYASLDSAIGAIREGAYDYLCKPFKLQEIEIAVTNATRLIHLRRENQRLLHKLDDLTAKLKEARHLPGLLGDGNRSGARSRTLWSPGPVPLRDYSPEEQAQQNLGDLERLRDLYKENMLTREEYQKLKERLFI
ncbi:MAG: response regulator [Thermodesulfobacteriota bacterium]